MPSKPKPKIMPLFARGYRLWCGLVVLMVGGATLWYLGSEIPKLLPGGSLDPKPYEATLRETESGLAGTRSLRAAVASIARDDQVRLAALVPSEPETSALIANLSGLTASQNVTLKAIDATPDASVAPEAPSSVGTISVTLLLKGLDYPRLKNYLSAVAANARLLDFISVSFSPQTPELTLQLRTYYLKTISGKADLKNLSANTVKDPRFRKLSMAHITTVQVGETGRENPFEPTAEPAPPPVLPSSPPPAAP